ncbi:molecular chaperone [Fusobacterium perfoetens]|uniref:fimbrial biogenesis chaperone n=1 Tax=Fusobacterium perfoetens TaxID=852 RepID=UPI001F47F25D|nr:fimbria/pilus periplasmic chaperone [Fusobacterium perfoetens]MCF2612389.1 molecular chaperone [Fusobacterium perfoetens]
MKKLYIFLSLLFINMFAYGVNFAVAPTRFEIKIDKVVTNEVYIFNNTKKPLRIETYTESDNDFGSEYNLDSNIVVFPKIVSIKPGGRQTVRFRVKPGQNLKDGEYKSYIIFKEVPSEIKSYGENSSEEVLTSKVTILTELGISVYGSIGEEILKGRIENFKTSYENGILSIRFDGISEGNTSFKYQFVVEDENGDILSKGKCGIPTRNKKNQIGFGVKEVANAKGKSIKVKILDQKNNILKEEKVRIKK